MPLYEIVLRYQDRDETRLTDHDPKADGHVRVRYATWRIIDTEDRPAPWLDRR